MQIFYAFIYQKRKKTFKPISLFALKGSACVKAACKMLVKLTLGINFANILWSFFVGKSLHWIYEGQFHQQFTSNFYIYKIHLHNCYVKTVWVCKFLAKVYQQYCKILVKLTTGNNFTNIFWAPCLGNSLYWI